MLLNGVVDFLSLFSAQMAYRTVHKFKSRLNGSFSYSLNSVVVYHTLNFCVGTEFKIDFICVGDSFSGEIFSDKVGQISAYFRTKRKLSVGKSACT